MKCIFLKKKGNPNQKEVGQSKIIYYMWIWWSGEKRDKNNKKRQFSPKKAQTH